MSFLQELKKVTIAQIPFNQVIPILSILRTTSSHTIFNTRNRAATAYRACCSRVELSRSLHCYW